MPDLGQSFSPAANAADAAAPNAARRRRTPVQQALQTLNLQLPTSSYAGAAAGPGVGPNAVAADLLSGRSGSVARQTASQPRAQALLNAMMSGGVGTQGALARGGGFSGGGFGDFGKAKPPSAEMPVGGAGGSMGGGLADLISKLPGGGGLPNLPGLPTTKPGMGAKPPGVPPLPPSLKPPVKPIIKPPPINPNIPGGGLVDRLPAAPQPVAPPVSFDRSNDPRFNTPIAQVPQAPIAQPPPPPPPSGPPSGYMQGAPPQYTSTNPSQYGGGNFRYPTSFNPYGTY
jgi:hypothetical protein